MPSLRRTISSPSVRSSPYPSLSNSVSSGLGSRGNGHRRSSGSETSSRRVLADIEWWRVADGQLDTDQESEDRNRNQAQDHFGGQSLVAEDLLGSAVFFGTDAGVEHSFAPIPQGSPETLRTLPTDEFAALSITPHTPRRHHARGSSLSSLESTPEASEAPFPGLRLSISDTDIGFPEGTLPAPPIHRHDFSRTSTSLYLRSFSFEDFATAPYADFTVSPLSSASPLLFN